jgi:hypothetical protein
MQLAGLTTADGAALVVMQGQQMSAAARKGPVGWEAVPRATRVFLPTCEADVMVWGCFEFPLMERVAKACCRFGRESAGCRVQGG